jgi:hypothetical protein
MRCVRAFRTFKFDSLAKKYTSDIFVVNDGEMHALHNFLA